MCPTDEEIIKEAEEAEVPEDEVVEEEKEVPEEIIVEEEVSEGVDNEAEFDKLDEKEKESYGI